MFAKIFAFMVSLWIKLPERVRKEVHSFTQTFFAVFLLVFGDALYNGSDITSMAAVTALVVASARTALKVAYNAVRTSVASSVNGDVIAK